MCFYSGSWSFLFLIRNHQGDPGNRSVCGMHHRWPPSPWCHRWHQQRQSWVPIWVNRTLFQKNKGFKKNKRTWTIFPSPSLNKRCRQRFSISDGTSGFQHLGAKIEMNICLNFSIYPLLIDVNTEFFCIRNTKSLESKARNSGLPASAGGLAALVAEKHSAEDGLHEQTALNCCQCLSG